MHGGPRINPEWLAIPYGESDRRLETNFATVSFLVQTSPRICTNFQVDTVWRMHISNLSAIFRSIVSKRRIQCVKSWLMELIYLVNQPADSKSWLFQAHPIIGNTDPTLCFLLTLKIFRKNIGSRCKRQWCCKYKSTRDAAGRSLREEE